MSKKKCCGELLNTINDYLDGELDGEKCRDLEQHLKDCVDCNTIANTMRKTLELYHEAGDQDCLPEDVRDRLFACLELGDFKESK